MGLLSDLARPGGACGAERAWWQPVSWCSKCQYGENSAAHDVSGELVTRPGDDTGCRAPDRAQFILAPRPAGYWYEDDG